MKPSVLSLLLVAAVAGHAADNGEAGVKTGGFLSELLPKAFQPTPKIEMTVYGERTTYGRTLSDVSPANPAYYVLHSEGYKPVGSNVPSEHPPTQEQIDAQLQRVLETRGYLPAAEGVHAPTLAIFHFWGSHSGIDLREVLENPELLYVRERELLQRAYLVGGRAYAEKYQREIEFGIPLQSHTTREENMRFQTDNNLYYVVVSAYDYAALAKGERRLVWRTTMTVNERGLNMQETLPPLIISATDFIGRDTGESVSLERRITRGSVTLGPLVIIGETAGTNPASSK